MSTYNFVQLALNLRTGERSTVRFTERDNLDGPEALRRLRRLLAHRACSQHPNVIQLQVGECLPAFADRALLSAVPLRTNAPAVGTPTSPSSTQECAPCSASCFRACCDVCMQVCHCTAELPHWACGAACLQDRLTSKH